MAGRTYSSLSSPAGRPLAVLRESDCSIVAFRLVHVRDQRPVNEETAREDFWSAIHGSGLGLRVRWLVLPSCVAGPPGHVEVHVIASWPGGSFTPGQADELLTLLSLVFPLHAFRPVPTPGELQFALEPFAAPSWLLRLRHSDSEAAVGLGFRTDRLPVVDTRRTLRVEPSLAAPERALLLMASSPGATVLEWSLRRSARPARSAGVDLAARSRRDRAPLAFDWDVVWIGSGGPVPVLLGRALVESLGVQGGALLADPSSATLSWVGSRQPPMTGIAIAHTCIPPLLPPPSLLVVLTPTLRLPVSNRLPASDLPENGSLLGRLADGREVRLSSSDRSRHLWVIGQTGTGKSSFFANSILEDIESGHGVCVLDPHGDLVRTVLTNLPAHRRSDVESLDVTRGESNYLSYNPIECSDMARVHQRTGQILELISSLWPKEFCGPMWLQACSHGLSALAASFEAPGTLAQLHSLFLDREFRDAWFARPGIAERVPDALQWFRKVYSSLTDSSRSELLDWALSKWHLFSTDPVLKQMLANPRSTLDLRKLMDQRGILLCNLFRGGSNPLATNMLTGVLMQAAFNAALSRVDLAPDQRKPFFLYCDEFQRIAGPSTGLMLAEVRKYGLSLAIAHQFVDQLEDATLSAVLGNVGTKLFFRVGGRDAQRLSSIHPGLVPEELSRLPNFVALAEVLSEGVPMAPFTLFVPPPRAA